MSKNNRNQKPTSRAQQDRYLERNGLLNYQTQGVSQAEVAQRYANARIQVDTGSKWYQENYKGNSAGQPAQPQQQIAERPNPTGQPSQQDPMKMLPPEQRWNAEYQKRLTDTLGYLPTEGQDPKWIADAYNKIKAAPNDAALPEYLRTQKDQISEAYNWFSFRNGNKPFTEWSYLNAEDPAHDFLKTIQPAPQATTPAGYGGATLDQVKSGAANWTDITVADRRAALSDPKFYSQNKILSYPQAIQQQMYSDPAFDWDKLPKLQKMWFELSSRPAAMGAINAGTIGAIAGGIPGGPVGALVGGAVAGATGAALGQAAGWAGYDQNKEMTQQGDGKFTLDIQQVKDTINFAMGALNYLAEKGEQTIGTAAQVARAAIDPNTQVKDVLNNATFNSSMAFYETITPSIVGNVIGAAVGEDGKLTMKDALNFLPWVYSQNVITGLLAEPEKYKGQEIYIGAALPVQLQQDWTERLAIAREQVAAGRNYREVTTEMQTGIMAQVGDLIGQTIFDPLNLLPYAGTQVGKIGSAISGNKIAAEAFRGTVGFEQAKVKYANIAQTFTEAVKIDPTFDVSKLSWVEKHFAGLNNQGEIKAGSVGFTQKGLLDPISKAEANPNILKDPINFWKNVVNETAISRAQTGLTMFDRNIGNIISMFKDPTEAAGYLTRIARGDNTAWAEMGSKIGNSPEWYTILPALKEYTGEKLTGLARAYEVTKDNRSALNRMAEVLRQDPTKLIDEWASRNTRDQDFTRVIQAAKEDGSPAAKALLEDYKSGHFTPDTLSQIVEAFHGEGALPYTDAQWKWAMYADLSDHFSGWVADHLLLDQTPEAQSAFFRMAGVLKQAQSILLLGGSPGYAIQNGLSGIVHLAVTGIYGNQTPKQMNDWITRWETPIPRLDEGVGIGGLVDTAKSTAISDAIKGTGPLTDIKRTLGKLSRGMPMSKLSSKFESINSKRGYVTAIQQFMGKSWRRGVGFAKMDPALIKVLQDAGINPDHIYSAFEAGVNQKDIENALIAPYAGQKVEAMINDAATAAGLKPADAAEMLDIIGVTDTLNTFLKGADTPEKVDVAFARANRKMQDWIDIKAGDDLKFRAEEVKNIVGREGIAAGLKISQQASSKFYDAWFDHYVRFGDVMGGLEGLDSAMRSKVIEEAYRQSDVNFRRVFENMASDYKGIFDAWGLSADPSALEALHAISDINLSMKKAYDVMRQANRELTNTLIREERAPTSKELNAKDKSVGAAFDAAFKEKHAAEVRMGEALGKVYTGLHGELAGKAARLWWNDVMKFSEQVAADEKKFRQTIADARAMGATQADIADAKKKYYSENKMRWIADMQQINDNGITILEAIIKNKDVPVTQTPTPTPPTPGTPTPAASRVQELIDAGVPRKDAIDIARGEAGPKTPKMNKAQVAAAEMQAKINGLLSGFEKIDPEEASTRKAQTDIVWNIAEQYGYAKNKIGGSDGHALIGALRKEGYGGIPGAELYDPRFTPEKVMEILEARKVIKQAEKDKNTPPSVKALKKTRSSKASDRTILLDVIFHGGLNKDRMGDVGGDPGVKYQKGIFLERTFDTGWDISDMARWLKDDGYAIDLKDPNDEGGVGQATELISAALGGKRVYPTNHDFTADEATILKNEAAHYEALAADEKLAALENFNPETWKAETQKAAAAMDLERLAELMGEIPNRLSNEPMTSGETFKDYSDNLFDNTFSRMKEDAKVSTIAQAKVDADQNLQVANDRAEAAMTRTLMAEKWTEIFGQEKATGYMTLSDAIAQWWTKLVGGSADEFYARYYADAKREGSADFLGELKEAWLKQAPQDSVMTDVRRTLDGYENGSSTIDDVITEMEGLIRDNDFPADVSKIESAIQNYREAQRQDREEWGGRGDSTNDADALYSMIEKYAKDNESLYQYDRIEGGADRAISDQDIQNFARMLARNEEYARSAIREEPQKSVRIALLEELYKLNPDMAERIARSEWQTLMQIQKRQVWYSKLIQTVEGIKAEKMTAEQLRGMLKGEKADEMKSMGLDAYLAGKQNVTKTEVLDFLRENQIEIGEKVMGGTSEPQIHDEVMKALSTDRWWNKQRATMLEAGYEFGVNPDDPSEAAFLDRETNDYLSPEDIEGDDASRAAAMIRHYEREWNSAKIGMGNTRYSQYVLPGGENYREVLFTLPYLPETTQAWRDYNDGKISITERSKILKDNSYQSTHWPGSPNVLAHTRLTDRIDADGKRVLFIEEIQSDWHQQGREKGYVDPEIQKQIADLQEQDSALSLKITNLNAELKDSAELGQGRSVDEIIAEKKILAGREYELAAQIADLRNKQGGIPDAPFKKNWHEMVMKRVLRVAAEEGYDKVAWTKGDVHYERWGSELFEWEKQVDGSIRVGTKRQHTGMAGGVDLEAGARMQNVQYDAFHNVVNKDELRSVVQATLHQPTETQVDALTKKLWTRMQAEDKGTSLPRREGLQGFYDKILPDFIDKYAKQWGAKTGETNIGVGDYNKADIIDTTNPDIDLRWRDGEWQVYDGGTHLYDDDGRYITGATPEEAAGNAGYELADQRPADQRPADQRPADQRPADRTSAHSIDINPAMRESVMGGQALFQEVFHGTPHKFAAERMIMTKEGNVEFITGKVGELPKLPKGANLIQDYPLGRFRLDKLGTGEGAQAYGWGLYVAELKGVAEDYRKNLSAEGLLVDGAKFDFYDESLLPVTGYPPKSQDIWAAQTVLANLNAYKGDWDKVKKWITKKTIGGERNQHLRVLNEMKESGRYKYESNPGQLYVADIPDTGYLMWDKKLSEQVDVLQKMADIEAFPFSEELLAAVKERDSIANSKTPDYKRLKELNKIIEADDSLGRDIYNDMVEFNFDMLSDEFENDWTPKQLEAEAQKQASMQLKDAGLQGIKYLDGTSRKRGQGTHNYVLFTGEAIKILDTLYQKQPQQDRAGTAKGSVTFGTDGIQATIRAFEAADFSTLIHENAHVFRRVMKDVAERTSNKQVIADLATIEEWAGVKNSNWTVEAEEKFARGFEKYIATGEAPAPHLVQAFQTFKKWMLEVYKTITGSEIDIKITPEVKDVFDRMLGAEKAETEPTTPKRDAALFQRTKQEIANPTNTPAFKNWFKESKVVDKEGKPVVMFHSGTFDENVDPVPQINGEGFHFGTEDAARERSIGKFSDDFIKNANIEEQDGSWFWSSEGQDSYDTKPDGFKSERVAFMDLNHAAKDYAESMMGEGDYEPNLTEVFLSIQNPIRMKDQGKDWTQAVADAKKNGYDGIVYKNEYEDKGNDSWIAFYGKQIKSVNNKGTYKGNNILWQSADLPLGTFPEEAPHAQAMAEGMNDHILPLMKALQDVARKNLGNKPLDGAMKDLSPEGRAMLNKYTRQVQADLAGTKNAATKWGESRRDFAMLNYNKRYGFDRYLEAVYPYQFFYTRSLATWAARALDKPAMFATYARIKKQQNRYERDIPERLRGKIKINMPWLPDWMGDALYIDPLKTLFTPLNYLRPLERMMQDASYQQIEAERILQEWAADGSVNESEIVNAIKTRDGATWERAYAEAQIRRESEINNPVDFMNSMLGPAWYLTTPWKLLKGQQAGIGSTPILNTTRAIETVAKGTWAQPMGDLIGMIGKPEEMLRKKLGIPEFGEYGDYYVDRQLANMVADGKTTSQLATQAMIERTGPLFDEARQRVKMELAMRVPTASMFMAGLTGANFAQGVAQMAMASPASLFGAGLLPAGELEYRGLKQEWNEAWKMKDAGDPKAITAFFDAHPEYESFLAKGKPPEERLKSFLIGQIWDGYMGLGKTDQKTVGAAMGDTFRQSFLDKETRSYDALDVTTLTHWAQMLSMMTPKTEATLPAIEQPAAPINFYPEEVSAITDKFFTDRTAKFPNYYVMEQGFYSLAKSDRARYLIQFPKLRQYWDWKDTYMKTYPELAPIMKGQVFKTLDTSAWPPMLEDAVMNYAYSGSKMGKGTYAALQQVWIQEGQPLGDMMSWVNSTVVPAMLYQAQPQP